MRKFLLGALGLLGGLSLLTAFSSSASAVVVCPAVGSSPGCAFIITFNPSSIVISDQGLPVGGGHTYDSAFGDDTLIGIVNNSGHSESFIQLTSAQPIFGFDGDGACAVSPASCTTKDSTGYGPNGVTFAPLSFFQGTVLFPLLQNGQTAWFSLEASINAQTINTGIPELSTWAMMIIGFAGVGLQLRRRARTVSLTA